MMGPINRPEGSLAGGYVFDLFLVGQYDYGAVIVGRINLDEILLFDLDNTGLQGLLGGEKGAAKRRPATANSRRALASPKGLPRGMPRAACLSALRPFLNRSHITGSTLLTFKALRDGSAGGFVTFFAIPLRILDVKVSHIFPCSYG
jgi:hypothetical protein